MTGNGTAPAAGNAGEGRGADQLGGSIGAKHNGSAGATQAQLISAIKAHTAEGEKAAEKSEQHYIAAGLHLKQLKDATASWAEWEDRLKKVGISASRASDLMQIADGRKTAEGLAIASTERSRRHRSSLRNEEARLDRAIEVIGATLKKMEADKRASILDRILRPIGMVAAVAKAGNGLCRWVKDDGGRSKSGIPSAEKKVGDCVARAIAIATQRPYREVHDALVVRSVHHVATDNSSYGKWTRRKGGIRHFDADHGCADEVYGPYLQSLGWKFTTTKGMKVHLRADALPPGRLIVHLRRHLAAVIDGVIHDTFNCGESGRMPVQGYWTAPAADCRRAAA
jgi:hypothetical protein